jgi:hypothetical protein
MIGIRLKVLKIGWVVIVRVAINVMDDFMW